MEITQAVCGSTPDGEVMIIYTMTNSKGMVVELLNIGAMIHSIKVFNKDLDLVDVTLGLSNFNEYLCCGAAMGKSVGRYANRIAKGRFTLDGVEYKLAANNGSNHLHGGPMGFANRIWEAFVEDDSVVFVYNSEDGEEGYPGAMRVEVQYRLTEENALEITFGAQSDRTTIINLTNHTYFNLSGEPTILDHTLKLNAAYYLPTDKGQIPTGESVAVRDTPMDFTQAKRIGKDIDADFEALKIGNGYDHCWPVDGYDGTMKDVAELYSEKSGIKLVVGTNQPAVQVYTGNYLSGCSKSKYGEYYLDNAGVAIECQNYPDAPNHDNFPSSVLLAGEIYSRRIDFRFSVDRGE